jgi:7-carboxy-7-deazaguanine synthase
MVKYQIAEKFKSIQGEGVYAGTPMAFIRFVGCSVGKKICQHCDTIFEKMLPWQGGGEFTVEELLAWASPYQHICLTGGEPFDQDLMPIVTLVDRTDIMLHVESSGTKRIPPALTSPKDWVCISPKPGFLEEVIIEADEVKVIVPGLGEMNPKVIESWLKDQPSERQAQAIRNPLRWPDISDALRWAAAGKTVFLQPRNGVTEVDKHNLMIVMDLLRDHPNLRLSVQMHKILKVQ